VEAKRGNANEKLAATATKTQLRMQEIPGITMKAISEYPDPGPGEK
jgi:hypothetical protein